MKDEPTYITVKERYNMAYSKENLRAAKECITARRAAAIAEYEKRQTQAFARVPELMPVERSLSMTGAKIMSSALSSNLTAENLAEIRSENERLRALKEKILTSNGYPADWLDIKYTCSDCSDTGYVGVDMCSCMKRELVRRTFESSGLGSLLDRQSFDNFSLDYYDGRDKVAAETNLKHLRTFAEGFSGKGDDSWLLLGGTGLGKTHLSTCVARTVIEKGFDVVYASAQDIISAFEARRFGGDYESSAEDRFFTCDLLIVDDLGVEMTNQFTVSCIYNIINSRINNRRSTLISTNLTQSELRSRYADRITSRLFGEFRPLLFTGRDIRGQKLSR